MKSASNVSLLLLLYLAEHVLPRLVNFAGLQVVFLKDPLKKDNPKVEQVASEQYYS
jgi:hypothetical protein